MSIHDEVDDDDFDHVIVSILNVTIHERVAGNNVKAYRVELCFLNDENDSALNDMMDDELVILANHDDDDELDDLDIVEIVDVNENDEYEFKVI